MRPPSHRPQLVISALHSPPHSRGCDPQLVCERKTARRSGEHCVTLLCMHLTGQRPSRCSVMFVVCCTAGFGVSEERAGQDPGQRLYLART
ncbi:hypothetical protein K466DRAFT_579678 [Polyporus arcularius HHB13444]|uniref:Uncharacterized protein n=1 Tax=Polyporus arcularius HHB13444 TaxID=1314778 RepID=A0A5C3Q349_9APHY|nr:hypothetical protein K466DRAFT_579678 [Polyporus arcularius HHB13444]